METGSGRWMFDGVGEITPKLALDGGGESHISPVRFVALIKDFLEMSACTTEAQRHRKLKP